jgi:hypothetical protein
MHSQELRQYSWLLLWPWWLYKRDSMVDTGTHAVDIVSHDDISWCITFIIEYWQYTRRRVWILYLSMLCYYLSMPKLELLYCSTFQADSKNKNVFMGQMSDSFDL